MNGDAKVAKAPMFVGLATLGGAGIGALTGGAAGLLIILLVALIGVVSGPAFGDFSRFSGFGWVFIESLFAFGIGAFCGAVAGALGGCLLGILFCFARIRWAGTLGGAGFGALTALYLGQSSPTLDSASPFGVWMLFGVIVAGGAVAGVFLTRLLLHLLDQEAHVAA